MRICHPLLVLLQAAQQHYKLQVGTSTNEAVPDTTAHHTRAESASTDSEKPAEVATGWQQRYTIVGLCFVAFMLCNMDRVNMSIAILPMQQEFQWTSQTVGIVQSSFFWCAML
jgi:MFS transporter, ACS family, solute carrier family 17 (sodium-dependent inorganic phosphate cotransporter), other